MIATLRELEATLTDGALSMFQSLVARANLRARKRLEETIALTAEQGRTRLARIADVLEALVISAREGGDIASAVTEIAALDTIEDDDITIRTRNGSGQTASPGHQSPYKRTSSHRCPLHGG